MDYFEDLGDLEYRHFLTSKGVTCPSFDGSGGGGCSVGGVTLSYRTCGYCEGYGLVEPEEV